MVCGEFTFSLVSFMYLSSTYLPQVRDEHSSQESEISPSSLVHPASQCSVGQKPLEIFEETIL